MNQNIAVCTFRISARATPGTLPLLLNAFAQRGLVPCRVMADRRDDILKVEICLVGLESRIAWIIREKMAVGILAIEVDLLIEDARDVIE